MSKETCKVCGKTLEHGCPIRVAASYGSAHDCCSAHFCSDECFDMWCAANPGDREWDEPEWAKEKLPYCGLDPTLRIGIR